jgi:hypothetical protein
MSAGVKGKTSASVKFEFVGVLKQGETENAGKDNRKIKREPTRSGDCRKIAHSGKCERQKYDVENYPDKDGGN